MSEYPYNDDLMVFDESTQRYQLTERALAHINLRSRISQRRGADATTIINRLLLRTTDMVYNYIHKFNWNNKRQDEILAKSPSARPIIFRALLGQVEYILMNGDLSRSVEADKRAIAIDQETKECLNTTIIEVGIPITYTGYLGG